MKNLSVPLTGDELIAIGETVNKVTERLKVMEDGTDENGLMGGVYDVIVYIEHPDALLDSADIVGQVRYNGEGWWAFYPRAVSE